MPQQRLLSFAMPQVENSSPTENLSVLCSEQINDSGDSQTSSRPLTHSRTLSTSSTAVVVKPRTSWVFKHMPDQRVETRYFNARTGREEWRCKHCNKAYTLTGGTAAPARHLTDPPPNGHGLPREAPRAIKVASIRTILDNARLAAEEYPRKRRRLDGEAGESIDPDQLEVLYVRFITACSLPLRMVECPEFRALLAYLNHDIESCLPDTHTTVKKWIMRRYASEKDRVKQRIQSAKSQIHISRDLWTSPNSLAILGVVAHYVTEDGQLEHTTLAMKDIDGEHDGGNLASTILEVIEDWGFASKLGYFVMDNAGNNDTMMQALSLGRFGSPPRSSR